MSEDESLIAVVAHGLVNSLTSVQGLLATARSLVVTDTADTDRIDHLLHLAEGKTSDMTIELRRLVQGLPPVGLSDGHDDDDAVRVVEP